LRDALDRLAGGLHALPRNRSTAFDGVVPVSAMKARAKCRELMPACSAMASTVSGASRCSRAQPAVGQIGRPAPWLRVWGCWKVDESESQGWGTSNKSAARAKADIPSQRQDFSFCPSRPGEFHLEPLRLVPSHEGCRLPLNKGLLPADQLAHISGDDPPSFAPAPPRRRPQFPQPEMIVAKRANKCWSAGRNRTKPSPEYRMSQEGADRASARRFVATAIRRRQNGLSGRAAYVRASGGGR
jgi:hypothetical protein